MDSISSEGSEGMCYMRNAVDLFFIIIFIFDIEIKSFGEKRGYQREGAKDT